MRLESVENGILTMFKIGLSVLLAGFVLSGCVANPGNAISPKKITQTEASPRQTNVAIQGNVAIVTQDSASYTTPRKTKTELKLEAIILDEIRGSWTDDNGKAYKLTKSSEQKMFDLLLPEAKKQFDLSFAARNTKLAEDETKSNIETTITESGNKRVVTERKLFSRGEEKLAAALENIKIASANISPGLDNLILISEIDQNAQTGKVTKNSEETIRRILTNVHDYASDLVDQLQQTKPIR